MQTTSSALPPTDRPSRFPLVFECLIWLLYVGLYKYSVFMGEADRIVPIVGHPNLPFPQLMLFALLATLYIVPYYRGVLPWMLRHRRYLLPALGTLLYVWWGIKLNTMLTHGLFQYMSVPPRLLVY